MLIVNHLLLLWPHFSKLGLTVKPGGSPRKQMGKGQKEKPKDRNLILVSLLLRTNKSRIKRARTKRLPKNWLRFWNSVWTPVNLRLRLSKPFVRSCLVNQTAVVPLNHKEELLLILLNPIKLPPRVKGKVFPPIPDLPPRLRALNLMSGPLVAFPRWKQLVRDGQAESFNIIEICSQEHHEEARTLWQSFNLFVDWGSQNH